MLGSCFKASSITLNWLSAEFACKAVGSYLTNVNSPSEQHVLHGLSEGKGTWIGMHRKPNDNSSWVWVNNSQVSYINDLRNRLDNLTGQGDCIAIDSKGKLKKWNCNNQLNFVCTIQTGKRKIFYVYT